MRNWMANPRKSGHEAFSGIGNAAVLNFWRYGFSNLNSNVIRGVLAEFLVECAVRPVGEIGVRNPWGDYDVLTPDGRKVEVKCSAYLQEWPQVGPSRIVWTGLKAKPLYWNVAVAPPSLEPPSYKADLYVLALFAHHDKATAEVLSLRQLQFYVLTRKRLIEIAKGGNSLSLVAVEKAGVKPLDFAGLRASLSQ
jgi:hypothetical protein